eukprot:6288610-Prymnesium_polylepis.1
MSTGQRRLYRSSSSSGSRPAQRDARRPSASDASSGASMAAPWAAASTSTGRTPSAAEASSAASCDDEWSCGTPTRAQCSRPPHAMQTASTATGGTAPRRATRSACASRPRNHSRPSASDAQTSPVRHGPPPPVTCGPHAMSSPAGERPSAKEGAAGSSSADGGGVPRAAHTPASTVSVVAAHGRPRQTPHPAAERVASCCCSAAETSHIASGSPSVAP